jgi:hypothetical protein
VATTLLRSLALLGVVCFGVVVALVSDTPLGLRAFLLFAAAAVGALAVIRQRQGLTLVFFMLVMLVEEFLPSLVVADRTDRRITILYGLSVLGVPGVYLVDVLLLGLLALGLLVAGAQHRRLPFLGDSLLLPLALTAGWIAIAAGISMFVMPDTTTPEAYDFDEVEIGLDKNIAMLVPFMQFKSWTYVYVAYMLVRLLLLDATTVRRLLWMAVIAAVGSICVAAYRFGYYGLVKGERGDLVYDDATLFVLTLTTCFFPLAWGRKLFAARHMVWQGMLMIGCAAVIAMSFRRATWAGFALCLAIVFMLLPHRLKARTLMVGLLAGAAFLVFSVISGGGEGISMVVGVDQLDRQRSAVYRLALIHNMLRGDNFTLLGYGVKPLWNVPLVMGSFHFNYENVHNLYYWFILRTGLIGLGLALYLFYRAIKACWALRREARTPWCATVAETLLIGFVLFMLLGWFHPLYGMSRFGILLGLLFGALMAVTEINRRHPAPLPPAVLTGSRSEPASAPAG